MILSGVMTAQTQKQLGKLMHSRGEYYFTLSVNHPSEIQALCQLCSVDKTDGTTVVCYANQREYDHLLNLGYQPTLETPPSMLEEAKMWDGNRATYEWDSYPTYSQYVSMMEAYPTSVVEGRTCTLMTLGTLSSGRKIMGVRINNGQTQGKPKFLYSSTIHGDETTGWILMLRLIDELCTSTDSRIVRLVDSLDIFIFPNANPDGTYAGGDNTVTGATRANGNSIDMNRNYPDPHSSAHPDGNAYQSETQWFMQLAEDYPFVIAANYHGGSEVVNYPWDNTTTRHADDAWWQYVSREYASLAQAVSSSYMTDENNGITNGADWYTIGGGRQDYMNGYRQCREFTVECSTTKNPSASQLPSFWNYNHNAMLAYMEQCLNGVHGIVYDANNNQPLDGVTITVKDHDDDYSIVSTHEAGDFHRPIKGGTYTFKFTKDGYCSESVEVTITDGHRVDLPVYLSPEGSCTVAMNCYESVMPSAAGEYVMGYLNGSSLISPSHNSSTTVTSTSTQVTVTDNGFSAEEETTLPQFTLTAYGSNGQYYISYNGRYLARATNGNTLTWGTSTSQYGRWYINSNGIYITRNNSNYYLYYNTSSNAFAISTTSQKNINFYTEGDCPVVEHTITATAEPSEGGTVSGAGDYEEGSTCTLTATANPTYSFVNWTEGGTEVSTDASYSFTVTADRTLVANFIMNTYTIMATADPADGGSITGAGTFTEGQNCSLTATNNEGFTFVNWTENDEIVSEEASWNFVVTSDRTLVAHFESTLHWTANASGYSNYTPITAIVQIDGEEQFTDALEVGVFCGEECRASAKGMLFPFNGHYILNLLAYGETDDTFTFRLYDHSTGTELTPEMNAPDAVTFNEDGYGDPVNPHVLNFTSVTPEYTLNVEADPTEGGAVSITGESPYLQNTEVTVTATPNPGYNFVNWTVNNEEVSTDAAYTFNADADQTLVAHFEQIEYTVTITADAEAGSAAITEAGPYHYNDVINLTYTENAGYAFVNFTVDGVEINTPYTVTGDAEIVANFVLNTVDHEFSFESGWNWWSTYIEMNGVNGLQLLEDALGESATQIKAPNRFLLYENHEWDGNLTAITNELMYRIATTEDGNFSLNGLCADPAEHPITLKQGWNWIGYVENVALEHNTALANMTTASENDFLKSYLNFATYYEGYGWWGELETMEPGQGYMIKVANPGSFTYPSVAKEVVINNTHSNLNKYWKPVIGKFADNMNVLAVIELDGNELRSEEAELAAFDENGECRGSAILMWVEPIDRYVAFLTVYGEDHDALSLRVRYQDAIYNVNEQLTMKANDLIGTGTNPYKMTAKGTGLNEDNVNVSLYPNPVNAGQQVRIELPGNMGNATVEIMDMMGRVVLCRDTKYGVSTIKTPNVSGVYSIRITGKQGQTWNKLLIIK